MMLVNFNRKNLKPHNISTFAFARYERLKSRKLIEHLFSKGNSFSISPLRILYSVLDNGISPLQAGFGVSAKKFKKAVERNRIKRLMKEGYRLQKKSLTERLHNEKKFMIVFFIYTGNVLPGYQVITEVIDKALKRLENIADENFA